MGTSKQKVPNQSTELALQMWNRQMESSNQVLSKLLCQLSTLGL